MARPPKPTREERNAQVRANMLWYVVFFSAFGVAGLWIGSWLMLLGAVLGLLWLLKLQYTAPKEPEE